MRDLIDSLNRFANYLPIVGIVLSGVFFLYLRNNYQIDINTRTIVFSFIPLFTSFFVFLLLKLICAFLYKTYKE